MKTIQIPVLQPEQKVAIANCTELGTVKRRISKNLYEVEYKGHLLNLPRVQIGVDDGSGTYRFLVSMRTV